MVVSDCGLRILMLSGHSEPLRFIIHWENKATCPEGEALK